MTTETIIATLLRAASCLKTPTQEVAAQSLKDAYGVAKDYLARKLRGHPDAADALEKAMAKPESTARAEVLHEEATAAALEDDTELARLIAALYARLPAGEVYQSVRINGEGNRVHVAGRDLVIRTERHYRRNVITPDDRHLSPDQRESLRGVIREVAGRLADDQGRPNFAAVHRMLQRHFNVVSYSLIGHGDFETALAYLKQQRAIFRSRLRRRNPQAYSSDLFRVIFTRAGELGWGREQVYRFAEEKLQLRRRVTSLKGLGPNQLKSLADLLRIERVPKPEIDGRN